MKRQLNTYFILAIVAFFALSACGLQKQKDYDKPLDEIVAHDPTYAGQILPSLKLGLLKADESRREYLMQMEDTDFVQTHFVSNEFKEGKHHFREIYNSYYDSTMGRLELYVSEFLFYPDSIGKLYRQLDYRVLLQGDSAFLREPSFSYLRLDSKSTVNVQDQPYEIYTFSGYSPLHIQDGTLPDTSVQADFTQIWNPKWGILQVAFDQTAGQQRLELQAVGFLEDQEIIAEIQEAIFETQ